MDINDLIVLQSPWLRDAGFVPREDVLPKRALFAALLRDITETKQIISLTGLRRVGKSTLLKQVIAALLKQGIAPHRLLYFSFDQPTVVEHADTIETILETYRRTYLGTPFPHIEDTVYIFLDEVQLVPYWQDIVKRYYDVNPHLKFIVSGSSSLFITKLSYESLAGRIFERTLVPLTFAEYTRLSGRRDMREFLDAGQFPELLALPDIAKKIEYLKEGVIGKVLEVDIVNTYRIRKTTDFERLFWSLLPNCGQIIDAQKLRSDLSMKKATLYKYLSILERSLLVHKVVNLSGSFRSEKRLLRKLYPASSNFLSLVPDALDIGRKTEAYVAQLLRQSQRELYLFHMRGKEVDFVVPSAQTAIEVKYQEHIHREDYRFLEHYVREHGYRGILVTKHDTRPIPGTPITCIALEEFTGVIEEK